jgi:hypothetical protein
MLVAVVAEHIIVSDDQSVGGFHPRRSRPVRNDSSSRL